jgi:hypothetical protein
MDRRRFLLLGGKWTPPAWTALAAQQSQWASISAYLREIALANIGATDAVTTFGNLVETSKWIGGVLAPNGCIYGIPRNSTSILKIDPTNDAVTTLGNLAGTDKWIGGVLGPNGCIYGIPLYSTSILKIDTATDAVTTFGNLAGTDKWNGGVLGPNG